MIRNRSEQFKSFRPCVLGAVLARQEQQLRRYLSPLDRIAYYREIAAESLQRAISTADPEHKAILLDEAVRWLTLATDVEQIWDHLGPARPGEKPAERRFLRSSDQD